MDSRRTIDELIARYCLEPELRDLYVEGPGEKLLFKWFFKEYGCKEIAVFEIECADVDILLNEYCLQPGNRNRVVVLAMELNKSLINDARCLACVADSDFDFVLGRKYNSRYLVYTDYTSIDLYFYSVHILEKLFLLGIRRIPCDISILMKNLTDVLERIFLIRSTNEKLGWSLRWVDFTRSCSLDGSTVVFDHMGYIEKYLSCNGRLKDKEQFILTLEGLEAVKVKTSKHRIRGHDYIELIGWYISKVVGSGGNKYRDQNVVRAIIYPAVDARTLANEGMFKRLLKIYGRP